MNTPITSLRATRLSLSGAFVAALGFFALFSSVHAAPVTSWTKTAGATTITGLTTDSPVFGDGTANSGNGYQINAALPSAYTLAAVGDSLSFTGSATFDLNTGAGSDQFRFGLFDTNDQSGTTGWLGYFATNSGTGANPNGRLWERKTGNTAAYFNNGVSAVDELMFRSGTPSNTFAAGTYSFDLTVTRTETGLSVFWSIIGTSLTYSISGTYADATPQTYTFDRVGFMSGGGLNADQVSFSNVDLTYTAAIPEPASAALLLAVGAGLLTVVSRRRGASRTV